MEEPQKVIDNSIGQNNSIVWKSKKWYTTNSKNKKNRVGSGNKKSYRTIKNQQNWLRFSAISSVLFSISCSENSDFSKDKRIADRKAGF